VRAECIAAGGEGRDFSRHWAGWRERGEQGAKQALVGDTNMLVVVAASADDPGPVA
jgi:hypothetical protein